MRYYQGAQPRELETQPLLSHTRQHSPLCQAVVRHPPLQQLLTSRGWGWRQLPEMTMTVLDHAPVTGDAGRVTGERQERPDPEVPERARRRTFTAAYKQEILAAYDAAGPGEKGAMLRRGGPVLQPHHRMAPGA